MMGPLHGSLKGLSTMNGRREALSCGHHGNRTAFFTFPIPPTDSSLVHSGIRQERSLVGELQSSDDFADIAYVGGQFFDHKGHRIHTCDWN
jgi:hypothetical protein